MKDVAELLIFIDEGFDSFHSLARMVMRRFSETAPDDEAEASKQFSQSASDNLTDED